MVRRILRWAFISTTMLDCDGPTLERDPAQERTPVMSQLRYAGDGTARAPSVAAAPGRLRNTPVIVCDGVPAKQRSVCPLDASAVTSIEDQDDGVLLHVRGAAREVGNRVQCYRALASVGLVTRTDCVLDLEDLDVSVRTEREHVVVDLTRDSVEDAVALRAEVRERLQDPQALAR